MDRIIEKKKWTPKKILWISLAGIFVIFVLYNLIFGDRSSKLNVRTERISIEEVREDYFQDYISIPGNVEPIRTVYMMLLKVVELRRSCSRKGSWLSGMMRS